MFKRKGLQKFQRRWFPKMAPTLTAGVRCKFSTQVFFLHSRAWISVYSTSWRVKPTPRVLDVLAQFKITDGVAKLGLETGAWCPPVKFPRLHPAGFQNHGGEATPDYCNYSLCKINETLNADISVFCFQQSLDTWMLRHLTGSNHAPLLL